MFRLLSLAKNGAARLSFDTLSTSLVRVTAACLSTQQTPPPKGPQSRTLEEWKTGIQVTVDAVRSGQLKIPTGFPPDSYVATCTLPEGGLTPLACFPEAPPGATLAATNQTFTLMTHLSALHESIKTEDVAPWRANEAIRAVIDNAALDAEKLREKHAEACKKQYKSPRYPKLPSELEPRADFRGALVHGIEGRGKSAALNFCILQFIAQGTPVVAELANRRVVYVPGGTGDVEVYDAKERDMGKASHLKDVVASPEALYFYSPLQLRKDEFHVQMPAWCTVIPTLPNEKNYNPANSPHHYLKLYLYDLPLVELAAVARVLKPGITESDIELYFFERGGNLRCLMSSDCESEFVKRLNSAYRAMRLELTLCEGIDADKLLQEWNPHRLLYGFCRPEDVSPTHMYNAVPYCNTNTSQQKYIEMRAFFQDRHCHNPFIDLAYPINPWPKHMFGTLLSHPEESWREKYYLEVFQKRG